MSQVVILLGLKYMYEMLSVNNYVFAYTVDDIILHVLFNILKLSIETLKGFSHEQITTNNCF